MDEDEEEGVERCMRVCTVEMSGEDVFRTPLRKPF